MAKYTRVSGYRRKNGTKVKSHPRRIPKGKKGSNHKKGNSAEKYELRRIRAGVNVGIAKVEGEWEKED